MLLPLTQSECGTVLTDGCANHVCLAWVCLQHFVCAKCEKPFLGHRHYERKGLAYCETHYNQVTHTGTRNINVEHQNRNWNMLLCLACCETRISVLVYGMHDSVSISNRVYISSELELCVRPQLLKYKIKMKTWKFAVEHRNGQFFFSYAYWTLYWVHLIIKLV